MRFAKFTRRQLLTLTAFGAADFCNAICVSLQAPFFPDEVRKQNSFTCEVKPANQTLNGHKLQAEKKGATATEYGCVFGVFELVVFLVSPWYGRHVSKQCCIHFVHANNSRLISG